MQISICMTPHGGLYAGLVGAALEFPPSPFNSSAEVHVQETPFSEFSHHNAGGVHHQFHVPQGMAIDLRSAMISYSAAQSTDQDIGIMKPAPIHNRLNCIGLFSYR